MKKRQEHIDDQLLLRIIEDRANEKEKNFFNSWIETSEENTLIFNQLKKVYHLTSIDERSRQQNWESVVQKVKEGVQLPEYIELPAVNSSFANLKLNAFMRVAALIVILLGISFLLKVTVFDSKQLSISGNDLNPGEPFQLADGSLVYLNGESEISFSKKFAQKDRELLLRGEAFFEVVRDEDLPFSIKTHNTITQVLGTSFNIYSDQSEHVLVSVVSGVVEFSVDEKKTSVKLEAGDQGSFDPELHLIKKESMPNQNFMAWKTGILHFDATPLSEAFQLLQKHYAQALVFVSEENDWPTLTTTIDNQSLEAVLEELNLLLNTNHESRNDTIFFKPNS